MPINCVKVLTDCVTVLHATQHKTGHFGDILPSQSLGMVLKKLKCKTVMRNTAVSIIFHLIFSLDNHHSSDAVYWRQGETVCDESNTVC